MKKNIAILLILIMLCMLFGCTSKEDAEGTTVLQPNQTQALRTEPDSKIETTAESAAKVETDKADETEEPVTSEETSGNTEAPPVTEDFEEDEDEDVEDTYSIIVDDNIGFGGN